MSEAMEELKERIHAIIEENARLRTTIIILEDKLEQKGIPKGKWELYKSKVDCYDIAGVKTWANKYRCECGFIHTVIEDFGHYDFCPHCGADMREAKE